MRPGETDREEERTVLVAGDEIDRVVPLVQQHHLVEDAPVRVAIEIAAVYHLRRQVEGVVVDEDRAQDGTLGFEIVRKRTFRCGDDGV